MTEAAKATWAEVVAWAKREVEKGRTALETANDEHGDITRIQARIAVMRDLQTMTDLPGAPEMPPSIPYT